MYSKDVSANKSIVLTRRICPLFYLSGHKYTTHNRQSITPHHTLFTEIDLIYTTKF